MGTCWGSACCRKFGVNFLWFCSSCCCCCCGCCCCCWRRSWQAWMQTKTKRGEQTLHKSRNPKKGMLWNTNKTIWKNLQHDQWLISLINTYLTIKCSHIVAICHCHVSISSEYCLIIASVQLLVLRILLWYPTLRIITRYHLNLCFFKHPEYSLLFLWYKEVSNKQR